MTAPTKLADELTALAWECFSDAAYYDMWCVRQIGERTFGQGFHLVNGDEAKALCDMLNARSDGWRDGVEAAAKCAENWYDNNMARVPSPRIQVKIATAIRNLTPKETTP